MTTAHSFDGLHHTQLAIPPGAEDRIRPFYRDVLGMTEIEKPPVLAARGGCWFRGGALELHFGVEPDFVAARKAHPGVLVTDLDALAKRLTDAGVEVDWDDNFPGHRRFYAFDPVGNRLEFLEPARLESRSGAGIERVRTEHGAAYRKVDRGAQRELAFYTTVAPIAPVRTPRLLDSTVTLLLADAGTTRPVEQWTPRNWAMLGRDLAALHRMPIPPGFPVPEAPQPDLAAAEAFWAPSLPRDVFDRLPDLERDRTALPPAFVHGDCHTENILVGADGLVFCDWQSAGAGAPSTDLAFPSVRATPAGVTVPPAFLDAYLEGADADRRRLVERATLAAELWTFLLLWPPFAAYNTETGIDRVRHRTRLLADRWLAR